MVSVHFSRMLYDNEFCCAVVGAFRNLLFMVMSLTRLNRMCYLSIFIRKPAAKQQQQRERKRKKAIKHNQLPESIYEHKVKEGTHQRRYYDRPKKSPLLDYESEILI